MRTMIWRMTKAVILVTKAIMTRITLDVNNKGNNNNNNSNRNNNNVTGSKDDDDSNKY